MNGAANPKALKEPVKVWLLIIMFIKQLFIYDNDLQNGQIVKTGIFCLTQWTGLFVLMMLAIFYSCVDDPLRILISHHPIHRADPIPHLEELRQICQEYYNTMWKVESEKYDEEFELMKKEFEVAYTQTWSYDSTPPSPPTSLESPSPLAIASAEPVSELSAPFWLFRKTWSANTLHALFAFFPLARLSKTLGRS